MAPLAIHLNGAPTGEGFVIVSHANQPLPATLSLRTTDGSEGEVELRAAQGSGAALSITPSTVHVAGKPAEVQVLATTISESQNDTAIEIVQGGEVVARVELTAIPSPVVRFRGRFQCRLATNTDAFDDPWGTDDSSFRLYAVHGGNPLDPTAVPDEPPLDRIVRFHNAVALRTLCPPIGVTVTAIEAEIGGARLSFQGGDPLLGLPVHIGPTCKIEERSNGLDDGFAVGGYAPISDFSLSLGEVFSGASGPAEPRPDSDVRPDSSAPYAEGIEVIGRATDPPWKPKDFGYPEATWEEHGIAVVDQKLTCLEREEPADARASRIRARRLAEHRDSEKASGIVGGFWFMQRYIGALDRQLVFAPNAIGTLAYLSRLPAVKVAADFLDFDSDCQSGTVTGTLGDLEPWPPIAERLRVPLGEGRMAPAESRMPARSGPNQ